MFRFLGLCFGTLVRLFCSRQTLLLENLALHQQLSVLKRRHPRPRLNLFDRLFWLVARHYWSGWKQALRIVTPETVVRWYRAGFRWYWKLISKVRKPTGRTPIAREGRDLIFQMVAENPTWGAPRIHGELLDSTLSCARREHSILYIYGLLRQGSVYCGEDSWFKSPVVIQMFEMFAKAPT